MIEAEDANGNYVVAETMLAAIEKARVFRVKKQADGRFRVREECDKYFAAYLTREQLHQLASELSALADS